MRNYKSMFRSLCNKIESLFPSKPPVPEMWLWKDGQLDFLPSEKPTRQPNPWIAYSEMYSSTSEFKQLITSMQQDESLLNSEVVYPGFGRFDAIIINAIDENMLYKNGKLRIDSKKAYKSFTRKINFFKSEKLVFKFEARLYGISFKTNRLRIGSLTVRKLTKDEINGKQIDAFSASMLRVDPYTLAELEYEATFITTQSIDRGLPNPFIHAEDAARKEFVLNIDECLQAMRLFVRTKCGVAITSAYNQYGHVTNFSSGLELPHPNATILSSSDVKIVNSMLKENSTIRNDSVLGTAFRYFASGKNKIEYFDKIVDYVMAFECILLKKTIGGKHQDISYKFMLNGASLLRSFNMNIDVETCFEFMSNIYSIRSKVVHGDSFSEIQKVIDKTGLDIDTLVLTIEMYFQAVFIGLYRQKENMRPYSIKHGWERLFWNKKLGG